VLFTDTLGDINGVSRFIRNVAEQAEQTGRDLTVLTSTNFEVPHARNIINIAPAYAAKMPKYENLELVAPPFRALWQKARELAPDIVHISTPGSVGLVGRVFASRMGLPLAGVYHTDFPAYIDKLFHDHVLTAGCTQYMKWFYSKFSTVFTRSDEYASSLEALDVPRSHVHTLRPGIMIDQFHPRFRDDAMAAKLLLPAVQNARSVRALYCGRLSVEKGMPMLARCWRAASKQLYAAGIDAHLLIVGDGPYREHMTQELQGTNAHFLGFRYAHELSSIYASSHFFIFPSTTDTLGQVVMESQASGLPVLVTDVGGPKEVMRNHETGYVLSARDDAAWVRAIVKLASDATLRERMGKAAHEFMQGFSMRASFEHYWSVHEATFVEHARSR
jgi:glycosyltransferase involved in cell wall biosynthesis